MGECPVCVNVALRWTQLHVLPDTLDTRITRLLYIYGCMGDFMRHSPLRAELAHENAPGKEYVAEMSDELAKIADHSGLGDIASLFRVIAAATRRS